METKTICSDVQFLNTLSYLQEEWISLITTCEVYGA